MNPDDLKVKILGIVGTPIKDGNCQYLLLNTASAAINAYAGYINCKKKWASMSSLFL
ncbi:MAG: hypothetical protein JRJ27_21915 [Deltaproteobacteria bacterium]|nr:hypothetical protein [Deltaproteobacteria bacterium]